MPVVTWESLVLLKIYAGGPQDLLDARQILKVRQPSETELARISNLAERLRIQEEWTELSTEYFKDG
ncbi:MAG: hypothetical protein K0S79_2390 [Nitrospira sp.]|nr:hypothetical protein [Nitrospira sp.]